jgi:hypothetical protein
VREARPSGLRGEIIEAADDAADQLALAVSWGVESVERQGGAPDVFTAQLGLVRATTALRAVVGDDSIADALVHARLGARLAQGESERRAFEAIFEALVDWAGEQPPPGPRVG